MLHDLDDPTCHGGRVALQLRDVLPLPGPVPRDTDEPVRVTVVGPDVLQRNRLMAVLGRTAGVEVVGWADSMQALAMLGLSSDACLAVEPGTEGQRPGDDAGEPAAAAALPRPLLSSRQQQVLVAYGAGNELLDVVARRLHMGPETLKTHLRRIRVKYEAVGRAAPTRRDLYVRALEDGLLAPPG